MEIEIKTTEIEANLYREIAAIVIDHMVERRASVEEIMKAQLLIVQLIRISTRSEQS